jgi:hypothetical protein
MQPDRMDDEIGGQSAPATRRRRMGLPCFMLHPARAAEPDTPNNCVSRCVTVRHCPSCRFHLSTLIPDTNSDIVGASHECHYDRILKWRRALETCALDRASHKCHYGRTLRRAITKKWDAQSTRLWRYVTHYVIMKKWDAQSTRLRRYVTHYVITKKWDAQSTHLRRYVTHYNVIRNMLKYASLIL